MKFTCIRVTPITGRDDIIRWQKILYEKGWAALNWPVEHGGTGWTTIQKYIFENEMGRVNAQPIVPFGIKMVGPIIYTFGNEKQKQRFLPDILASDAWWCQGYSEPWDDIIRWQKILYEKGWAALNWPVEHGGTGWTTIQKYIFENEMGRVNAQPIVPFGIKMVGPIIYTFGNEKQKQRFLPDILASDAWWCQGYSEPGSGSDLASLKTKADRTGDHYIVNGTKTWTTLAHYADWIFCQQGRHHPLAENPL